MGSFDLKRLLNGWEYDPGQITVRRVTGDDGKIKIQMRLDLGLLQMETEGRPDGKHPHGCESLLAHHEKRLEVHFKKNGTELGFELSSEECQALRDESVQYYHRYLAEFVLEDFIGVERDTHRNLRVLDLCRDCGKDEAERTALEQYRPYLIMMNTRAHAHIALRKGSFKEALSRVVAGIVRIEEIYQTVEREDLLEDSTELAILRSLREEIAARLPVDPLEKLEGDLQKALIEERYEEAAKLRDRLDAMKKGKVTGAKKRKK